jgi:hypothetical protein
MIHLPVSLGEAIDKLTILDIKTVRIANSADSKREYALLYEKLRNIVETYPYQYRLLRSINDDIWVMQDELRAMAKPDGGKCIDILNKNDMRFRIKDAINRAANSELREQKGYPTKRALFIGHLGLGDMIGLNGAVRYVALQHDETYVVCKETNRAAAEAMYSDMPSIKIVIGAQSGYIEPPTPTTQGEAIQYDPKNFTTVYRSGLYKLNPSPMNDLPSCFYLDMGIDQAVRHTFFHVPHSQASKDLHATLKVPYIFTQQKSSGDFVDLVKWDRTETLTIDPNVNVYPSDHPWYEIAQAFVNRPFLDYVDTIENASEIHTVDSSFYCLASYLTLKASKKGCYDRVSGALIPSYAFN